MPRDIRKWLEILLPIVFLGGAGGVGLEWQSSERYIANEDYVNQVSIEFLEFELRYNEQIGALRERTTRLEAIIEHSAWRKP